MSIGNPVSLTNNVAAKTISVTATPGQTLFTVTGGYRINQLSVYRNGTRLVDSQDYTARDGATVTLLSPASGSDVIEFQVFDDFRVADALNVNSGGTVNGNVTVTGIVSATSFSGDGTNLTNTGSTLSAASGSQRLVLTSLTSGTMTASSTDADLTWNATTNTLSATNVSIAGTLTYEDVTNVDSIGLVTARNGAIVNAGTATTALIVNGDARVTGILTIGTSSITLNGSSNQVNVGAGVTLHHTNGVQVGPNTLHSTGLTVNNLNATGILTAASFSGNGSGLTGIAATADVRTNSLVVTGVATITNGPLRLGDSTWYHTIGSAAGNTELFITANAGQGNATTAPNIVFRSSTSAGAITERARIDSSGRLLIGTNSSDWTRPRVVIVGNPNETTTGAGVLYLQKANGTVSAGDKIGEIAFSTSSSNVGVYSEIICEGDATGGSADFPGRLVFKTCTDGGSSTVERLRITSSGGVVFQYSNTTGVVNNFAHGGYGFGGSANTNSTTLTDQRCGWFMRSDMQNTNNELGNSILLLQDPGGAAVNPGDIIKGYRGSTFVFRVANDGSLRNSTGSYAAISDERLKQDIVDAPSQWDDIKAVKFKKFKLKDDVERSTEHPELGEAPYMLGVIAQEIEQVSPGLIDVAKLDDGTPDPDSMKSVKYSILYMKAVRALQEAMERIEVLEEKVNILENKS